MIFQKFPTFSNESDLIQDVSLTGSLDPVQNIDRMCECENVAQW